jgi:trans-aconitate methyltransferase
MKDWNATLYNDKHAFVYHYGSSLIELLEPKKGERILDVGCGSGQLTEQIAQYGAIVSGIDNSEQMIKDASDRYPHIDFYVKSAADFSFDQPFDAIFSNAALHWVLDKELAVQCMSNGLKRGGRLVLEMGGKGNVATIINELKDTLRRRGFIDNAESQVWYFPTPGEYITILEKYGFAVELMQYYERPTELADSEHGVEDWLEMFGISFFEGLDTQTVNSISKEIQQKIKPKIFRNNKWHADYKRLRIKAIKL